MWNPAERARGYIETQIRCFRKNMEAFPERDPNAWLAESLRVRMGWRGRPEWTYYVETALFSLAPDLDPPAALGLFLMYKEEPDLAAVFGGHFERIMATIFALREKSPDLCEETWCAKNPWTGRRVPEVIRGFRMTPDEMSDITAMLDRATSAMPTKGGSRR